MTSDSDPGNSAPSGAIPLRSPTRFRAARPGHRSAAVVAARLDIGPVPRSSPQAMVARQRFTDLDVVLSESDRAFWCFLNPRERPSFTPPLLADLASMRRLIDRLFAATPPGAPAPLDYFVLASRAPGVFLLGGDLSLFAEKIRSQDREGLRQYAQACVTASYANYTGYGHGVVTVALIQGDALGGGLEAPLSCDLLIAERQARFGLPEVLFNLFPGVGAYSFLSRRIGSAKAEEMIFGGRLYTAPEMHALGVIDVLADEGTGEQAVREHIARYRSRHRARSAIYDVRRRVNPVPLEELRDIADLWVDTALRMTEQDLRKMARMATGQARAGARGAPVERAAGD